MCEVPWLVPSFAKVQVLLGEQGVEPRPGHPAQPAAGERVRVRVPSGACRGVWTSGSRVYAALKVTAGVPAGRACFPLWTCHIVAPTPQRHTATSTHARPTTAGDGPPPPPPPDESSASPLAAVLAPAPAPAPCVDAAPTRPLPWVPAAGSPACGAAPGTRPGAVVARGSPPASPGVAGVGGGGSAPLPAAAAAAGVGSGGGLDAPDPGANVGTGVVLTAVDGVAAVVAVVPPHFVSSNATSLFSPASKARPPAQEARLGVQVVAALVPALYWPAPH